MSRRTTADADPRRISVVDAVCCVYFCAAGKSGLFISILSRLGLEILIPEEVEREVLGKRSYGQLSVHWRRMKASDRVQILPLLTVDDRRADVVACVARVRDTSVTLALSARKDLGEAVVVGHAQALSGGEYLATLVVDEYIHLMAGIREVPSNLACSSPPD
jgi:hypothetical protein